MSRGAPLTTLAAGLASGYLLAKDKERAEGRQDRADAQQKELHDARMADIRREETLRTALEDAGKPVTVGATPGTDVPDGEMGPSQTPPTLASYQVGGQSFLDRGQADAAAAQQNTPEAIAGRQATAYRAGGMPEKALTLENAMTAKKRSDEQYTQEQRDRAAKLQQEGVFNALRAFRAGDASGLAKAFNMDGEHKLDGEPVLTKVERDVPGVGKIATYDAKVRIKGPDGQVQEKTYNSHDLSMQMMPYEKALELMRKGSDSDNKASYQQSMLETKIKQLELAGQVAEARALKAAANGGTVGREERLRYTSLFSEAGRRMGEAQRTLGTLQKDPVFMLNARKPGSAEAAQLGDLCLLYTSPSPRD